MDKGNKTVLKISCIIFIIGMCMLAYFLPMYIRAKSSTRWPMTTGEIISMEKHTRTGSSGSYYEMRFSYTVDGKPYTAADAGRGILVGKRVDVYYKPDSPGTAVLYPGSSWGHYIALGMGSFLAVIGAYISIAALFGKVKVIE